MRDSKSCLTHAHFVVPPPLEQGLEVAELGSLDVQLRAYCIHLNAQIDQTGCGPIAFLFCNWDPEGLACLMEYGHGQWEESGAPITMKSSK